jgi:hypothetical protein
MQVLGLPVAPGDEMVVVVWMGDQGSATPNPTGGFGAFSLTNMTRGVSTAPIYTPVASTNVSGTEAVWIMERPTVSAPASGIFGPSGYIPDLANYGSAVLSDAYAHRAAIGYLRYLDVPTVQVSMVDSRSTDVLSTVTALDSTSMRFDWKAFN